MLALPLPAENISYRILPFQLHKNIGLTLLIITIVMVAVRLITNREQAEQIRTKREKLALIDYWAIYVLIGTACLTGYLSSSYSGWETVFWWLVDFPAWAEESDELNILLKHSFNFLQKENGSSVYLRLSTRSIPQLDRKIDNILYYFSLHFLQF